MNNRIVEKRVLFLILPCYFLSAYFAIVNPALQEKFLMITLVGISGYFGYSSQVLNLHSPNKEDEEN